MNTYSVGYSLPDGFQEELKSTVIANTFEEALDKVHMYLAGKPNGPKVVSLYETSNEEPIQ